MFCQTCKTKLDEGAVFCRICGRSTNTAGPVIFSANPEAVEQKLPAMMRCGQCGYEGRSVFARSIPLQVIAWLCLFILRPRKNIDVPTVNHCDYNLKIKKGNLYNSVNY